MSPPAKKHWQDLPEGEQRAEIASALERSSGHVLSAASRLGVSRMALWRLLRDLSMLSLPEEIRQSAGRRFRLAG